LRLRVSSFGGYGLALAELALVVFGAYDGYPLVRPQKVACLEAPKREGSKKQRGLPAATL